MKLPRPVILLVLLPSLLLAGCQSYWERHTDPHRKYYRVRVTNPRGEMIADYIAENAVRRTERGFEFQAVERTSAMPLMTTSRYPHGRKIEVAGPNIVVTRSGKPEWLYQIDGY